METKERVLKDLRKIYKQGHIPNRGCQEYILDGNNFAAEAGSYEHAVINLTNEQLKNISPIQARMEDFVVEPRKASSSWMQTEANFVNYTKSLGLKIEECADDAEVNPAYQWKIAYYRKISSFIMYDVAFALQEKDKSWTAKFGNKLLKFPTLPQYIQPTKMDYIMDVHYSKFKTYVITNPYAKKRYEKNQKRLHHINRAQENKQEKSM